MKSTFVTQSVLQHLGISKSYIGYNFILYGMDLIMLDERYLNGITKILYIDIAHKFQTSHVCVERNIRKIIEVIWKHSDANSSLISKIFGERYAFTKPSNREFLELLYSYVKRHDVLKQLQYRENIQCPISNEVCTVCIEIIEKLLELN